LLVVLLRSKGFWPLLRWKEGKTCFVVFVEVERERERESARAGSCLMVNWDFVNAPALLQQ
jgi:hypothetical protein